VSGLEVKKLVASPLYRRFANLRPAALDEIKNRTGLDPEKDIDRVVIANTADKPDSGVMFVFGNFSLAGITQKIEAPGHKGVTEKKIGGETLFSYEDQKGVSVMVVVVNEHALLLGTGPAVQVVAANLQAGTTPLRTNKGLVALLGTLPPGVTFWMAGDAALLSQLPKSLPGSQNGNVPAMNIPNLSGVAASGDLDPDVKVNVQADALDAPSAKNLADVIRGLLALAVMQAGQKPALQGLATAVNVTSDQNKVVVSARLPYELLDALVASVPAQKPAAPAAH
jgi:hypothetical protein